MFATEVRQVQQIVIWRCHSYVHEIYHFILLVYYPIWKLMFELYIMINLSQPLEIMKDSFKTLGVAWRPEELPGAYGKTSV